MIKRYLLGMFFIFLANISIAQFRIGPIGGINFNRQILKSNTYRYEGVFKSHMAFNAGVIADFTLNKHFSFQPELIYTLRGGKYKLDRQNVSEEFNTSIGYISMPLSMTAKLDLRSAYWIFGAGPYIEKLLHSQHTYYSNGLNIENGALRVGTDMLTDQIKPWAAGVKLKTGFELKRGMYLVAFYDFGTSDLNPQPTFMRTKTFGVQASFIFSTTEEDRYERFEKFYEF